MRLVLTVRWERRCIDLDQQYLSKWYMGGEGQVWSLVLSHVQKATYLDRTEAAPSVSDQHSNRSFRLMGVSSASRQIHVQKAVYSDRTESAPSASSDHTQSLAIIFDWWALIAPLVDLCYWYLVRTLVEAFVSICLVQ